jgi:hypothetical protein
MATGLPTLSQIRAWDIDHLIEAAEHWDSTADHWDNVCGQVWQQSLGMDWQGQARDALVDRTTADTAMVTPRSDQLREASLTARRGAGDISAVQRSVLYRVDDAHEAGFIVGEDLSVTDTQTSRNAAALARPGCRRLPSHPAQSVGIGVGGAARNLGDDPLGGQRPAIQTRRSVRRRWQSSCLERIAR